MTRYIDDDHGDLALMRQQEDDVIERLHSRSCLPLPGAPHPPALPGCLHPIGAALGVVLGAAVAHPACTVAPVRVSPVSVRVPNTLVGWISWPEGIYAFNSVGEFLLFDDPVQAVAWAYET